jgi:hypothetical protein
MFFLFSKNSVSSVVIISCISLRLCGFARACFAGKKNPPFGGFKTLFSVGGALLAQCNEKTFLKENRHCQTRFTKRCFLTLL